MLNGSQEMVASINRKIFAMPGRKRFEKQFAEVTIKLGRSLPKVTTMLGDVRQDLLAFAWLLVNQWELI